MQNTKIINGTLPWTDRTEWLYPAADKNTLDWWFKHGPLDVDPALEVITPKMKQWRTCIQAGGAIGVWPIRLSQFFERVITFEPEPVNWKCLRHNAGDIKNINMINAALGDDSTMRVHMGLEPRMQGHCGAWQVMEGGDTQVIRIDDLSRTDVDLIYLDIEGYEYNALMGAVRTIKFCRPVIGLEDKGFRTRYNNGASPIDLLIDKFDYQILCRPFRTDVILVPC